MLLDDRKDVPAMAVSITGIRVENSPARMIENKRFKQIIELAETGADLLLTRVIAPDR